MDKKIATFFAVVFVALALGFITYHQMKPTNEENATEEEILIEGSAMTQEPAAGNETASIGIDLEKAKTERILGNPDAPVKISEHASFSCGHCAHFHLKTLPELKKNWIDTGRAYLVYSDFPLNAPALHATLVSRCIKDDEQFFAFTKALFEQQEDWAYTSSYLEKLKALAKDFGIDDKTFDACTQNEELQQAIVNRVRANQQQYDIDSTPSFVVNNTTTIKGALPYETFNEKLEEAISGETENAPKGVEESTEEEHNHEH